MIRKAKPSEIVELITITNACAVKMASEGIFQWDENYPNTQAFEKDRISGELYVLIHQDTVIGCITISTKKDEEYNQISWLTEDKLNYYIHRLAVHPDFQRCGNAKKLMDFAEMYANQQKAISIRLDTFSKNLRNQEFYKARGYTQLDDVYFPRQTEFPFHCYELPL
ncbi:GNAT family N-acetyltransferase [Patiriisocius sp. Uisw_017]|jgi:ribosomal protein S18 acetylase RimI-like enzyme|uniref:GNAT family N-acetyltransferase n=1 Tax=Patiriisocius sp. Uisw_017 TaxID=3230968 RepID=UPI0039E77590